MTVYLLYAICGSIGGFLGGLLGLGGGIIFVPTLFFIFTLYGLNSEHLMQSAVSTSLACVVISSLSAALKHNKNKLINWLSFKKMLPGLMLGSVLGVILITVLSNEMIKFYYGILLILISIYLIFEQENKVTKTLPHGEYRFIHIFSCFTGSISTMLGIGGGTLTTPYFKYHGDSMKTSIATAAACLRKWPMSERSWSVLPASMNMLMVISRTSFLIFFSTNLRRKDVRDLSL